LLDPLLFVVAALAGAGILSVLERRRASSILLWTALVIVGVGGISPLPQMLLRPLESRFPVWSANEHTEVTGIIILGGGLNSELAALPSSGLSPASGRIIEAAILAKRLPQARVVYSGGGGEAQSGRDVLVALGVPPGRISEEGASRTTFENARFSAKVVRPQAGDRWLLITSAFHMPRAIAAFRAAGFRTEAVPVDFRARRWRLSADIAGGLELLRTALKEYVGLVVYRITGRTEDLFPEP
jgi:uncharacterized SAM-binding protein YcdF (DUF218 family)